MSKVRGFGSCGPGLPKVGLKNALRHGLNAGVGVYPEPLIVDDIVLELAMPSGAVRDLADIT